MRKKIWIFISVCMLKIYVNKKRKVWYEEQAHNFCMTSRWRQWPEKSVKNLIIVKNLKNKYKKILKNKQ